MQVGIFKKQNDLGSNAPDYATRAHERIGTTRVGRPTISAFADRKRGIDRPYSSNLSPPPSLPLGAIAASGATAGLPGSRKRLTIG